MLIVGRRRRYQLQAVDPLHHLSQRCSTAARSERVAMLNGAVVNERRGYGICLGWNEEGRQVVCSGPHAMCLVICEASVSVPSVKEHIHRSWSRQSSGLDHDETYVSIPCALCSVALPQHRLPTVLLRLWSQMRHKHRPEGGEISLQHQGNKIR